MQSEGKRIKEVRNALRLNQQELADLFDISRSFIASIECGNKSLSKKHLRTLLIDYNVNINYILSGIGEMFITKD